MTITWSPIRNEFDQRAYRGIAPSGAVYLIDGNGAGRMRWTLTYPNGDVGITDSMGEAKAWAETFELAHSTPETFDNGQAVGLYGQDCTLTELDGQWYLVTYSPERGNLSELQTSYHAGAQAFAEFTTR